VVAEEVENDGPRFHRSELDGHTERCPRGQECVSAGGGNLAFGLRTPGYDLCPPPTRVSAREVRQMNDTGARERETA
jgi:hypothetical protein